MPLISILMRIQIDQQQALDLTMLTQVLTRVQPNSSLISLLTSKTLTTQNLMTCISTN